MCYTIVSTAFSTTLDFGTGIKVITVTKVMQHVSSAWLTIADINNRWCVLNVIANLVENKGSSCVHSLGLFKVLHIWLPGEPVQLNTTSTSLGRIQLYHNSSVKTIFCRSQISTTNQVHIRTAEWTRAMQSDRYFPDDQHGSIDWIQTQSSRLRGQWSRHT